MITNLANILIKENEKWNTYLDLIYPIGSLYFSYVDKSPAESFGGSWTPITGAYIYADASNEIGGRAFAPHTHSSNGTLYALYNPSAGGSSYNYYRTVSTASWTSLWRNSASGLSGSNTSRSEGVAVNGVTDSTDIELNPTYQAVYCYRRVA